MEEKIELVGKSEELLDSVSYSKSLGANGNGHSLEKINPSWNSSNSGTWSESVRKGGTPCEKNSIYSEFLTTTSTTTTTSTSISESGSASPLARDPKRTKECSLILLDNNNLNVSKIFFSRAFIFYLLDENTPHLHNNSLGLIIRSNFVLIISIIQKAFGENLAGSNPAARIQNYFLEI